MCSSLLTHWRILVVSFLSVTGAGAALYAQQSQQPPVFRAEANLVEVIVRVTDREGRFIPGLTQTDFALEEEGRAQTIVAFNGVDRPWTASEPDPRGFTLNRPLMSTVATNRDADQARLFVLVLDDILTSPHLTLPVRRFARDFVERFVGPSDLVAVFPTGGWGKRTQEFTADKARALATIDRFIGQRCRGVESDAEKAYYARVATEVLGAVAEHLAGVRGRRVSLVWVSEGIDYPLTLPTSAIQSTTVEGMLFGRAGPVSPDGSEATAVAHAMNHAIQVLRRANVTLYALDPRGLFRGTPPGRDDPCASGAGGRDALVTVAESTGGFAAIDSNDYSREMVRIVDENSQYYVLGYQPNRPGRDGEMRRIRVRVTRSGLQRAIVTARSLYQVSSRVPRAAPPRTSPAIAAALTSSLPGGSLPLRVQAVPRRGSGERGLVYVVVEAGGSDLEFIEQAGRFTERMEVGLLTVDDLARQQSLQTVGIDLSLTAPQAIQSRENGLRWLTTLELEPGHYSLRVAGHAVNTMRTGAIFLDVDVPKYRDDELRIEGLVLTSRAAALTPTSGQSPAALGLPGPPTTARSFVKGDVVTLSAGIGLRRDFTSGAVELTVQSQSAPRESPPVLSHTLKLANREAADPPASFEIDTALLGTGQFVARLAVRDQENRRAETALLFEVTEP